MDKEDTYNGILFSQKKEWNSVICRDIDRPRDCHTKWNKSEREKQVSYHITYMWNLEKWYRLTYLESRNRDIDVEDRLIDTNVGRGWMGWIGRLGLTAAAAAKSLQSCPTLC